MTARVTGAVADAAQATIVRPVLLAFLDFLSDPVYAASTGFDIDWSGHIWRGVGQFGAVGPVEETIEAKATQLALTLSGVDVENLGKAIADRYQGRTGRLLLAFLDEAYAVIPDPITVFEGPMDAMPFEVDNGTASITVTVTDGRADWERPRLQRYTNEDQQKRYPGDKGFEFVPQMVEKQLVWGR